MAAMTLQTAFIVTLLMPFVDCYDDYDAPWPWSFSTAEPDHCSPDSITTSSGCIENYDDTCYAKEGVKLGDLCVLIKKQPVVEDKPRDPWLGYSQDIDDAVIYPKTPYDKTSDNGFKPLTTSENYYVQSICGQGEYLPVGTWPDSYIRGYDYIDGFITMPQQYPWTVSIDDRCSGVLISPRHVLTAIHCVERMKEDNSGRCQKTINAVEKPIYYGGLCLYDSSLTCNGTDVKIATASRVIYPESHSVMEDDLALILLDKDIEFDEYVQPICMGTLHRDVLINPQSSRFGMIGLDKYGIGRLIFKDSPITDSNTYNIKTLRFDPDPQNYETLDGSGGPLQASFNGSSRQYLIGVHTETDLTGYDYHTYIPCYVDWLCQLTGVCELKNQVNYYG